MRLQELLGIELEIIQAPMAGMTRRLAAGVATAALSGAAC